MKHFVIWSALAMLATAPDRVLATSAVRALPQHVQGGTAFDVVITVDPPVGTTAAGIEDGPPAGWDAIASISPTSAPVMRNRSFLTLGRPANALFAAKNAGSQRSRVNVVTNSLQNYVDRKGVL